MDQAIETGGDVQTMETDGERHPSKAPEWNQQRQPNLIGGVASSLLWAREFIRDSLRSRRNKMADWITLTTADDKPILND